ncbi:MAG: sarcosine oxidase subunit gamma family protein [Bauldia sp.]
MAGVIVTILPEGTRYIVRGDPAAFGGYGVTLPREACRAATNGTVSALWLGPDEWLVLAPDGQAMTIPMASVVEVSDRQVAIGVSGPRAADAINAFNALDLHIESFPVGMCTRTLFGKAEIVLWRTAPEAFHIEVWRSFAPYVLGCLAEAAREYD